MRDDYYNPNTIKILPTNDSLGIGGMLLDAFRLCHLLQTKNTPVDFNILQSLLKNSLLSLDYYLSSGELYEAPQYRLAFREFGLSIGLRAIQLINETTPPYSDKLLSLLKQFKKYDSVIHDIESFWLNPEHQRCKTWLDHIDINEVMLATSLAPEGFLSSDV